MDTENLLKYLNKAIEVETDIAIQEQLILEFETEVQKQKPVLKMKDASDLSVPEHPAIGVNRGWFIFIGAILGVLVLICLGVFCVNFRYLKDDMESIGQLILWCLLAGLLLGIPLRSYRKEIKEYEIDRQNYQDKWNEIEKENRANKQKYEEDLLHWRESHKKNRNEMEKPLKLTKEVVEEIYAKNVIYPKYRNLPALTSICEYFITGRCTELTGPYGAYNLYEDEIRKDMVISQLSLVIENIESIKHNQYMLYEQVKSIRQNTDMMARELRQISGYMFNIMQSSAITAYYSQVTAKYARRDFWNDLL